MYSSLLHGGETMNLKDAALCLDCEELYVRRNHNQGCPACGGRQSAPIVRFLKSVKDNKKGTQNETKMKLKGPFRLKVEYGYATVYE